MFNELLHNYILHIFNLDQDFFISVNKNILLYILLFYFTSLWSAYIIHTLGRMLEMEHQNTVVTIILLR